MARWRLGRAAERRGMLGEGQQEGVKTVGELGGDAWRPGEVGGALGGAARRPAAALLRGRGRAEEEEKGGRQGLRCKLQKLQGPHCNTKFSTILKLK
jgi:hypothetical protein